MKGHRILLFMIPASAALSCDRRTRAPVDSVSQGGNAAADVEWVTELGPVLAVPGDNENTALLLMPSAPTSQPLSAVLLRPAGDSTVAARLTAEQSDALACDDAPAARASTAGPSGWTIAFAPTVSAARLDSLEHLSPADSATLASDVARLASAVADVGTQFSGLPFAVLGAYRLRLDTTTVVVARVARRIPQEAAPLEERTILVGERRGSNPFTLKYSLRSAGAEDTVEHYALLAVVRAADKHFLVLEAEREAGTRFEIVERSPDGSWRLRWTRQLSC
jgi:hypothetical protein